MEPRYKAVLRWILAVLMVMMIAGTSWAVENHKKPTNVPEFRPGVPAGFLNSKLLPNSSALVPPSPAEGSATLALDEEVSRKALALRNTPRWVLAVEDANLKFPQAAGTFSCALNAPITEEDTPFLYMLLRRVMIDAGIATYRAKMKYKRPRPFVVNKEPICTPEEAEKLSTNGSYPSGHAAIGWAWALVLCEISPDETDAILGRGWAFGQSRMVCNVHWQSDVLQGRLVGAATVARLHADPTFRVYVEEAKAELAAVRARSLKPTRDCEDEAAEISVRLTD